MEIDKFSKTCKVYTMTPVEMKAFRKFLLLEDVKCSDLIKLAKLSGTTSAELIEKLIRLKIQNIYSEELLNDIISEFEKCFSMYDIMNILMTNRCSRLAIKLFWCNYDIRWSGSRVMDVPKIDTKGRKDITSYFVRIKNFVHERRFSNPYQKVKELGCNVKLQIEIALESRNNHEDAEEDERRLKRLYDKYVALKAIEYDAGSNVDKPPQENDETFQEIENALEHTSFPSVSRVLLYGRKADAMSTLQRFQEGQNMLIEAYVSADVTYACLEMVDMIYKGVVFKLSQFEQDQSDEILEEILADAEKALSYLSQEDEAYQKFWKILLKLRKAFALLGIGKQCRMIKHYYPGHDRLKQSLKILNNLDYNSLDIRKKMFYNAALARYNQHIKNRGWCEKYLEEAVKLALQGNYSETKFLKEYGHSLGRDFTYLQDVVSDQTPRTALNMRNPTEESGNKRVMADVLPELSDSSSISHNFESFPSSLEEQNQPQMCEIENSPSPLAHGVTMLSLSSSNTQPSFDTTKNIASSLSQTQPELNIGPSHSSEHPSSRTAVGNVTCVLSLQRQSKESESSNEESGGSSDKHTRASSSESTEDSSERRQDSLDIASAPSLSSLSSSESCDSLT